ncbi:MAG: carboxypeptidase regulatory-like domain-containing protein [Bacteroidales bacterium]|nr:carboxypeptidase regulatory-like domain-containing protein [Bacteroidales bacterium]
MKNLSRILLSVLAAVLFAVSANAQFTTSSLGGKVTDENGEALAGAAVIAVHTPSGTQYYGVANGEGRYSIQGMRPGGPYTVTVSLVGSQTVVFDGITLALGETYSQNASLKAATEFLEEVVVVGTANSKFSQEKTGASTNISNREMMNLPTTSRSIKDLTKLSPYSNGMSLAGGDGRSTNFTVDGANFNNNFGLSSNLPGGGTPISLDALEEVQIVIAPYDVRQSNFVGGGINAITKSGTNTFKGTAYTYYYDQRFRGNVVAGEDLGDRDPEANKVYGFTLGGPIIKNKLFFFVNFESTKNPGEQVQYRASADKTVILEKVKDKLVNDYGYNPGSLTSYPGGVENQKILARLDWNISDAHKLALRFNRTLNDEWNAPNGNSCDDQFRNKSYNRASEQCQPFSLNMYSQMNNVTSIAAELNSRFGDKASNQLIFTYTDINDQRGSKSSPFPHIDIMSGYDKEGAFTNIPYTSFGYELFTWNNGVKNKVYNLTDNFTYYAGAHKITAGASYEHQLANNSYMRNGTGYYRFATVDDFLQGNLPMSFALCYGWNGEKNPTAQVQYSQIGAYVQDDWAVNDRFKLTYGVRFDSLVFDNDDLMTNSAILKYDMGGRAVDTGKWPSTSVQVSPRIGFNWDVFGDRSLKVRGGTGVFMGRLPLVFFTNMPTNAGMVQNLVSKGDYSATLEKGTIKYEDAVIANLTKLNGGKTTGGTLITDVDKMVEALGLKTTIKPEDGSMPSAINGVDPKFKMPQVWKTSLAADYTIPVSFPFTVTAEGMFTKTLNGVMLSNWNIDQKKVTDHFAGADDRLMYPKDYKYGKTEAYVLTNTNKGYGYTMNLTLKATPAPYLDLMAAYTRTESKEISGMPGSNATSAYEGLFEINGSEFAQLQRSQYVIPDKFTFSVSYFIPFSFFNGNGLHLNAYYTMFSPNGYSYIYANDMNGDGNAADLMYIPKNDSEIKFVGETADADRKAFWAFVEQDKYLSSHKGQYAEAYAGRSPWIHRLDLRVAEDFAFRIGNTTHNFQLSVSADNVLNMINSSWGVHKYSAYSSYGTNTVSPLKYAGAEGKTPTYTMNKIDGQYVTETFGKYFTNTAECWSLLFGIKYFFN